MRTTVVMSFASTLLRHADGELTEAFRVRSQASRREVVAEEWNEMIANLPSDAAR